MSEGADVGCLARRLILEDNVINFQEVAKRKAEDKLADTVLNDLGLTADELANVMSTAPDEVRMAILDSLERRKMYKIFEDRHAALDEEEGIGAQTCCNAVCANYKLDEEIEATGPYTYKILSYKEYCGANEAQGCKFRMTEAPPCDPFVRYPSHAEAIRTLMRNNLLEPDEFGHYNGTDFAHKHNTVKLWWSYVNLLIESGKIPKIFFIADDGEEIEDRGEQATEAKKFLFKDRNLNG